MGWVWGRQGAAPPASGARTAGPPAGRTHAHHSQAAHLDAALSDGAAGQRLGLRADFVHDHNLGHVVLQGGAAQSDAGSWIKPGRPAGRTSGARSPSVARPPFLPPQPAGQHYLCRLTSTASIWRRRRAQVAGRWEAEERSGAGTAFACKQLDQRDTPRAAHKCFGGHPCINVHAAGGCKRPRPPALTMILCCCDGSGTCMRRALPMAGCGTSPSPPISLEVSTITTRFFSSSAWAVGRARRSRGQGACRPVS